jgi:hypothetical protein
MAILKRFTCKCCNKFIEEARPSSDYSGICYSCEKDNRNKEERDWKAVRSVMPMEERIRDIENFMYHHSRQQHYAPPTVFG